MALFFTALLGLSASILGYFIYDFSQQNFVRETEAVIDAEIASFLEIRSLDEAQEIPTIIARREARLKDQFYLYVDASGAPVAGNLKVMPEQVERLKEGVIRFHPAIDAKRLLAAKIHTFEDGSLLVVARDIHAIASSYERMQLLSGLMIGLMLIVVVTSFFISDFVVKRINLIAQTARNIMETGNLSRRISIDSSWDDLSNLAQILNALLARIEMLMEDVRQVSDNVAHDLRTPLTRLRNRLESLRATNADPDAVDALIREADHLLETFNALLRIANVESGKRHHEFTELSLDSILQDVAELYAPLAEEKQIHLAVTLQPASRLGDRDLLFQAFANLFDNAIKFTPDSGCISVSLEQTPQGPFIRFADSGCGIADGEKAKVFQRFYRAESSRTTPGNGLGLSMVAAVIALHHGSITLKDGDPGLCVDVQL